MTPGGLDAEVWLRSSEGSGNRLLYAPLSPTHNSLALSPPMATAMRQADSLLAAVSPGLLGATVKSSADSLVVEVLARSGWRSHRRVRHQRHAVADKAGIRCLSWTTVSAPWSAEAGPLWCRITLIDHFGGLQVNVYVQTH